MSFIIPTGTNLTQNQSVKDFMEMTARLNDYNEITSLNNYILNNNTSEYNKLKTIYTTVSSQLLRMKQEYLIIEGSIQKYNLWITVVNITTIAISLCFIILCLGMKGDISIPESIILKQPTAAWICVGIAVVYFLIVSIILSKGKNRRAYSWNQYYWNPMK